MVYEFKNRLNYDFSGKRVRYCGHVMNKFDICCLIDDIKPNQYATIFLYDICRYDVLANMLKSLLN